MVDNADDVDEIEKLFLWLDPTEIIFFWLLLFSWPGNCWCCCGWFIKRVEGIDPGLLELFSSTVWSRISLGPDNGSFISWFLLFDDGDDDNVKLPSLGDSKKKKYYFI